MLHCKLDFACKFCGQRQSWYIHPMDEKTLSGDYKKSFTHYKVTCKKCNTSYLLKFNIHLFERGKKKW